jgi:hypothetical protein
MSLAGGNPMSGAQKQQDLDKLKLTTEESRTKWAVDKSNSLAELRAKIASGTAEAKRVPMAEAL